MENYKLFINDIKKKMKSLGFKSRGESFYIFENGNCGIVSFQKSRSSDSTSSIFTINIGVSLLVLRKFFDEDLVLNPKIEECHWKDRIGFLLPDKQDKWWQINRNTHIGELFLEICDLLQKKAIPEILKYLNGDELEKEWLRGHCHGLTEFQRFKYLSALMNVRSRVNVYEVIEELKKFAEGKPFEFAAKEHIKALLM